MRYLQPIKFCSFPSLGYWKLNGRPVSSKEALGTDAKWVPSEICLEDHFGELIPDGSLTFNEATKIILEMS